MFSLIHQPHLAHLPSHPQRPNPFGGAKAPTLQQLFDSTLERFSTTLRQLYWTFPIYDLPGEGKRFAQADFLSQIQARCSSLGIALNSYVGFHDPFYRLYPLDGPEFERYNPFADHETKMRTREWERELLEQGAATREVLSFAEGLATRMEKTKDCEGLEELMRVV